VLLDGLLVMVIGPTANAVDTVSLTPNVLSAGDPSAGPNSTNLSALLGSVIGGGSTSSGARAYVQYLTDAYQFDSGQREVLDYVTHHDNGGGDVVLAVEGGSYGADPFLLDTDARVAPLGGYVGFDPSPTVTQLAQWVQDKRVRFVLLPQVFLAISQGASGSAGGGVALDANPITDRLAWISTRCSIVPPRQVGPAAGSAGVLFDCGRPQR
jgi:hypothetical protein